MNHQNDKMFSRRVPLPLIKDNNPDVIVLEVNA